MLAKLRYLHTPPGRDDLYFRRKVPEALRSLFSCGEFYKVPLGTKDPRAAEPLLAIANGEYEKKLAAFREIAKNQAASASLSETEAATIVDRYLTGRSGSGFASGGVKAALILMELDRSVDDLSGERTPTAQSMSAADWQAYRKRIAESDSDAAFDPETLVRLEHEHQARHRAPGSAWFAFQSRVPRRRWRPLLTQVIATLKRETGLIEEALATVDEPLADALTVALSSPEVRQQLPQTPLARRRGQNGRARPELKLDALCDRWAAARSPTPKAISGARTAVAYFASYIGDVGIGEITADDCFEFRDALVVIPAALSRSERALPFADLVARYQSRTDLRRVQPASVKKYLGSIQALLSFAFQERFVPQNVAAGIKVEGYTKRSDRRPFTKAELQQLFAAPLFTAPWSKGRARMTASDATLRWLFLLALCSGGRIEELGQILLSDIQQADGVWYIDVTPHIGANDAAAFPDASKRLKTDSSVRVIPLHPRVLSLGFVEHVLALRKSGQIKLFADLQPDSMSVQTKAASRLAARVIDKAVSDDPRIVFHSFRHSFKDLCRDANIPKDVHDQLTGHAAATAGDGYGLGRAVGNLAAHLEKIDLSFIDWSAIERALSAQLRAFLASPSINARTDDDKTLVLAVRD